MKKTRLYFIAVLLISIIVLCTACSKKEQDNNTEVSSAVTDSESPEQTEDNKNDNISIPEPDFICKGSKRDSREESIALNSDVFLSFLVPVIHDINASCVILKDHDRLLFAIDSAAYNMQKRVETNTVADVMSQMEDSFRVEAETRLNGSAGYKEMVIESEEDFTVNGVDLKHFIGYVKGLDVAGEDNGKTYYMEGYTYVHSNQVPAYIIGLVLYDKDEMIGEDGAEGTETAEDVKNDLIHNLHEMINTIKYKDDPYF